MKKIIVTIISLIIFFIIATFTVAIFIINNGNFLTNFKFINVTNTGTNYYIYYEKSNTATKYEILVYDNDNKIINKSETKYNSETIKLNNLNYNEKYKIIVIAYDKDGNRKSIKEPYNFIWNELSFSDTNLIVMDNNNDYIIDFVGDYKNKNYKLNINKNDVLQEQIDIKNESYTIKNYLFKDESCYYTLEILEDSVTISTLKIYNLMSPITDITFTNPNNGDMMQYSDVPISFTGGDNASNYLLELYRDNKLIRRKEIKEKNVILSSNLFDKKSSYKVKITASYYDYLDYSKTNEINFSIDSKETLKPVYTNYKTDYIKKGTKIKLLNNDKNAKIYYTIDGSEPNEFSNLYKDEITINNDTIIKAIAIEEKKNNSSISEFNFKIGNKNKYKVYLSASNQNNNLGVSEVGYTNEKKEMNDLTNYIEKRLNSYGVKTYRNEFGDINRWTQDSTYLGVDLHLAIHSNASEEHTSYGIETWVHNETSKTYSLAQNLQNNLFNIYYNKEDELANRGVKYANGSLAEVNPAYTPCGILIEVAHHDYLNDAKWIMENKEKIGNNIADTILEYWQIK